MQPFVPVEALFKGRHFDGQIIILCVTWYTSFELSLRDLVIMMADRGIRLTHTTINLNEPGCQDEGLVGFWTQRLPACPRG